MTTAFVDPLLQLFDNFGAVLAGGTVDSYEAGTTTPLATYTDLAGNTANTNPVVLDSAGRATIRATVGTAYKFVVKDSDGNTIETIDNVTIGAAASASSSDILVTLNFTGTPGAQALMGGAIFDRDVTFPIDFEGADGIVRTNPASDYTISVTKNGTEVGTIVIDSSGTWTFATTGHTTVAYTTGDYMSFIAPDSGSAADFIGNITGAVA